MRMARGLVVAGLAMCISGCGGGLAGSGASGAAPSTDARVERWKVAWSRADNEDLDIARDLVANPPSTAPNERAAYRVLVLRSLVKYARSHDPTDALDQEAERDFEEGSKLATDDRMRAGALSNIALYYNNTQRPGRGLPYLRRGLGLYQRTGDRYHQWATLVSLSAIRNTQGDFAVRDADWRDAVKLTKDFPPKPVPLGFWRTWFQALDGHAGRIVARLNNASGKPDVSGLERLWPLMERAGQHIEPKALVYSQGATWFAAAGRLDRARELLAKADALAASAAPLSPADANDDAEPTSGRPPPSAEDSLAQARSFVAYYSNDYATCAKLTAQTVDSRVAKGKSVSLASYRWAGECAEGTGDLVAAEAYYRKGVALGEELRGSFTVAERASVFRGQVRTVYWGLMRTLAKQSLATTGAASDASFLSALQASDLVRARQLGELLETRGGQTGKLERLDQLKSALGPDDALVSYTVMEREVLVLAVTRERHVAAIIPVTLGDLVDQASAIATSLAKGDSDLEGLQTRLGELGKTVLAPIAPVLAGKKRLLVLSDGVLNIVPFDLLSAGASYRPLVDDTTVQLLPSIQMFLAPPPSQAPGTALLAVGDPTYSAKHDAVGDTDDADDGAATRGSKYLGYFTPLPETRDEVKRIAALFEGGKVKTLLGGDATESNVTKLDFAPYGFVHFATHGILGRDVPGITEPAIVLANEAGQDGFLTASDAMKLHLNAQLTVLSACKTGAGDYQSGEGVMGMSRAFLVAGSRSALVSLWSVDSAATEALMVDFYKQFKSGVAPAEALRRAKLAVRGGGGAAIGPARGLVLDTEKRATAPIAATAARKHPFYWGAFVLVGR